MGTSFSHLHPLGRALITTLPRNSLATTQIPTAALANIFGAKDGFWALAIPVRIISPSASSTTKRLTCVVQIVRNLTNVNNYLIFTAAPTFLRCDLLFFLRFRLLITWPDCGRTEAANISFYLGIGWCYRMRSSQSRSVIQYPFFSEKLLKWEEYPQGVSFRVYHWSNTLKWGRNWASDLMVVYLFSIPSERYIEYRRCRPTVVIRQPIICLGL